MIRTLLVAGLAAGSGVIGWLGGSIWPAPPEWTDAIDRTANDLRAKFRLENVSFTGLRELISPEQFDDIKTQIEGMAIAKGDVIPVDHEMSTLDEQLDNLALDEATATPGMSPPPAATPTPSSAPATPAAPEAGVTPSPAPAAPAVGPAAFAANLALCPSMTVTNAPAVAKGVVTAYHPFIKVKDVRIAAFPTPGACLSSGFGPRADRLHKGLDFHSPIGVPVLAGGDGEIVELKYREDYGNMILISHGGGVYTRYAHLASFGRGLTPGVTVRAGDQLGLMGNSASYQIPIHLHYELLLGDYANPKGSFGLTPSDPLTFPAAN